MAIVLRELLKAHQAVGGPSRFVPVDYAEFGESGGRTTPGNDIALQDRPTIR